MVDRLFSEPLVAELYDAMCAGRPDFAFYLPLVIARQSVLDIGCGTGELLRLAREAGHTGRLCGLDPAEAMLDVARRSRDIEWVLGEARDARWQREFDLIVMTGHAFQVLLTDEELRASLTAIWAALSVQGRFVFETRNPLVRTWETWGLEDSDMVHNDIAIHMANDPAREVEPGFVTFGTTFSSPAWDQPIASRSTLRFLEREAISLFLMEAGLEIEEQFGDWDRSPVTDVSPEIITVARHT